MLSAWAGAGRSLSVWFEISHGVAGDGLWPTEMSVREGVSVRMWGTRDFFFILIGHSRYLARRMAQGVELMMSTETMDDGCGIWEYLL